MIWSYYDNFEDWFYLLFQSYLSHCWRIPYSRIPLLSREKSWGHTNILTTTILTVSGLKWIIFEFLEMPTISLKVRRSLRWYDILNDWLCSKNQKLSVMDIIYLYLSIKTIFIGNSNYDNMNSWINRNNLFLDISTSVFVSISNN